MNRRTLALVVVILGLIYLAAAAICLYGYFYIARLFGKYGVFEAAQANIPAVVQSRNAFRAGFVMFVMAGIPTLLVGLILWHATR